MGNKVSRCIPVRQRKYKSRDGDQAASVNASNDQEIVGPSPINGLNTELVNEAGQDEVQAPLPPGEEEPVRPSKLVYVCLYEFQSRTDGDLSFAKGEEIEILNNSDGEWWYGKSLKSGQTGYIPSNYIEPINSLKSHE